MFNFRSVKPVSDEYMTILQRKIYESSHTPENHLILENLLKLIPAVERERI